MKKLPEFFFLDCDAVTLRSLWPSWHRQWKGDAGIRRKLPSLTSQETKVRHLKLRVTCLRSNN